MVLARYSRPKLLLAAALLAALSIACAWMAFGNGNNSLGIRMSATLSQIFLPVLFIALAAMAAKIFSMAFGSLVALEHSAAGLVAHTNWSRHVVPWNDYAGIAVEGWSYRAGLIPVGKVNYLLIHQRTGGLLGDKKLRLTLGFMELDKHQVAALGARIDEIARKGGAMPAQSGAAAQPVIQDSGPKTEDSGFDPDAAIARYMASRAAQPPLETSAQIPVAPARPAFGRKGISA